MPPYAGLVAPPVTAHAVLRWLTRCEDFNLRPLVDRLGRDAGNWTIAEAAARDLGVTVEALQRRILPEHLWSAVRGGAAKVRANGMVLICKNGRVVTLVEKQMPRGAKILSEREMRKGAQKLAKRRRKGAA